MRSPETNPPTADTAGDDVHAFVIRRSLEAAAKTVAGLDSEDPLASIDDKITDLVARLEELAAHCDPLEALEQVRIAVLPWSGKSSSHQAGVENGFAIAELLAIAFLSTSSTAGPGEQGPSIVEECQVIAGELIHLGLIRATLAAGKTNPVALIQAMAQTTEVVVRATSYPELVEDTLRSLFLDAPVDAALRGDLGFGFVEAIAVLNGIHELQTAHFNSRMEASYKTMAEAQRRHAAGADSPQDRENAKRALQANLRPNASAVTVATDELARSTGLGAHVVEAILDAFSWSPPDEATTLELVASFISGGNPLRKTPVVRSLSGRAMLTDPTLNLGAIRDLFEETLHSTPTWESYQNHRGDQLERLTRVAFEKVFPDARAWHGLLYYVPDSSAQMGMPPSQYTKRVEGDHLLVIDDVAIVIEDKAVAFTSPARSGVGKRLRRDLTGIITKAAEQAERLATRIREDGGLRVHGQGWVDMSEIREIHSVAVSLDDLSSISTATAELIQAGVISGPSVPWTVSIHDLQLIVELTTHPADFLLYLRRRRHPLATVLYTAADELDLFLYFLESGLYVADDPDEVRARFPFLSAPTSKELRAWASQEAGFITSRTDALDAWYQQRYLVARRGSAPAPVAARMPRRGPRHVDRLIEAMDGLQTIGRYSLGAALLAGDSSTQWAFSRHGLDMVGKTKRDGREHTLAVPLTSIEDGGWLLVWASRPASIDLVSWEESLLRYVRIKGHKLHLARGALFGFDEYGAISKVANITIPSELTPEEVRAAGQLDAASVEPGRTGERPSHGRQRAQPRRPKRRKRR